MRISDNWEGCEEGDYLLTRYDNFQKLKFSATNFSKIFEQALF
jgi:hypothetical protein